jgi:hypothetical protein
MTDPGRQRATHHPTRTRSSRFSGRQTRPVIVNTRICRRSSSYLSDIGSGSWKMGGRCWRSRISCSPRRRQFGRPKHRALRGALTRPKREIHKFSQSQRCTYISMLSVVSIIYAAMSCLISNDITSMSTLIYNIASTSMDIRQILACDRLQRLRLACFCLAFVTEQLGLQGLKVGIADFLICLAIITWVSSEDVQDGNPPLPAPPSFPCLSCPSFLPSPLLPASCIFPPTYPVRPPYLSVF